MNQSGDQMTIPEIIFIFVLLPLMEIIFYYMGYRRGWNDADQYSEMYKKVHDYIMENRRAKKQAKR